MTLNDYISNYERAVYHPKKGTQTISFPHSARMDSKRVACNSMAQHMSSPTQDSYMTRMNNNIKYTENLKLNDFILQKPSVKA